MDKDTNKLFLVTLRGLQSITGTQMHENWVIAKDPDEAYQKVKDWLDKNNYGFHEDRELETVELIAEEKTYPACRTRLFM